MAIRTQVGGKGGGTGGGKTGESVIAAAGCRAVPVGAHNGCRAREGRWR